VYVFGAVALFPELIDPVVRHGVIGRARNRAVLELLHVSPREFASDRHKTVDDRPYGGGPGMVLRYEPLRDAIRALRAKMPAGVRTIALTAGGRPWDATLAREMACEDGVILVAGRYEGIDERVIEAEVDLEVSIGDYVLSGGELGAAVIIDSVARLLPGVLGHEDSSSDDSFMQGLLGYPQYTRPERADGMAVPAVLLRGDHERVRRWRLKQALGLTWQRRPDLLRKRQLSDEERELLDEYRSEQFVTGS
jgi:tRNA (guanine37-N1)-methyltransferase